MRWSVLVLVLVCVQVLAPWQTLSGADGPAPAESAPPRITRILDVRNLTYEQARQRPSVHLIGVVTWAERNGSGFILADEESAIWVYGAQTNGIQPQAWLEIRGFATEGYFTASVTLQQATLLGTKPLPAPRPSKGREQLLGLMDNLLLEVHGTVFERQNSVGMRELMLLADGVPIWLAVPTEWPALPSLPRLATVTGISCLGIRDREVTDCSLLIPSWSHVQFDEAPYPKPPQATVEGLLRGTNTVWLDRLVELSGVVTWVSSDRFVLQQEDRGILVLLTNAVPPTLYREVRVTGAAYRTPKRLDFVATEFRSGAAVVPPPALDYPASAGLIGNEAYGRRVRLRGRLVHRQAKGPEDEFVLVRSERSESFRFSLPVDEARHLDFMPFESTLEVRGVLLPEFVRGNQSTEAVVLLGSARDVRRVRRPPLSHFWTVTLVGTTSVALLGMLGGAAWWGHTIRVARLRQTQLESENRLKSRVALIAETASDLVVTLDFSGRITFLNPAGYRMLAVSKDQLTGLTFESWIAREGRERWRWSVTAAAQGAIVDPFEIALERTDNMRLELEMNLRRLNDEELQCIGRDLTETRRARREIERNEHRLRTIVETMTEGILVLDSRSQVISANRGAEHILAVSRGELIGRDLTRLWSCTLPDGSALDPDDHPVLRTLRTGDGYRDFLVSFRAGDGQRRWVTISSQTLVRGKSGAVEQVIATFADVTARRAAEMRRHQVEEQLRHSEKLRALGTLAGGVAHDFNNLLASVQGNAELIQFELPPDSPAQESARQIAHVARRGAELVRRILSFSRPDTAAQDRLGWSRVVDESLRVISGALPPGVRVVCRIPADEPTICGDPGQLSQIVVNLCTNAGHAMEAEGGDLTIMVDTIEISPERAAANPPLVAGRVARLEVRDTGCGMSAETLTRVYEPFFTTKSPGRGTGLGLSIVHNLVEAHGGRVFIRSTLGAGTCVEVLLPLADPIQTSTVRSSGPAEKRGSEQGRGEEILAVDDDPSVLPVLERTLRALGYRVTALTSPSAALEQIRRDPTRFRLLLTDLAMPEQSGVDLALSARRHAPDLPIVIATGYGQNGYEELNRAAGSFPVLSKPFQWHELAELIRSQLALSSPTANRDSAPTKTVLPDASEEALTRV